MNILLLRANGTESETKLLHPLGLLMLSAVIKKNKKDAVVKVLDTRLPSLRSPDLARVLKDFPADIIGISAMTNEARSAHGLAAGAKKAAPAAKVVIGGPYPTTAPELALADGNIDCAVIGEGEATVLELLDVLSVPGVELEKVKGLAFMKNGALQRTPPRELIEDLDSLPFPDWDAVDIKAYPGNKRMSVLNGPDWMSIFTSRGCPYQCVYCHNIFGKRFRARSAEKVMEEIDLLHNKYGIKEFDIIEDIFNYDRERTERICDHIAARGHGISLSFPNGLRLDRLDCSLLDKLKKAGTKMLVFPVETVVPRLQTLAGRSLDIPAVKKIIDHALRLDIFCTGFFMIGFPGETEAETELTVKFAVDSGFHAVEFFTVTPFRGTRLWETLSEDERDSGSEYTGHSYFRKDISPRLIYLQRMAYMRFYLSPKRVARTIAVYLRVSSFAGLVSRFFNVFRKLF